MILKKGEILVDGKARKDHAYPAGLFDVISIPRLKKFYRIVPSSRGLEVIDISEKESKSKMCMIKNKSVIKKGKIQLNLHDGRNILVEKDEYKTGDSILIEVPGNKIIQHIPIEKGSTGIITRGKNSGKVGEIKEIMKGSFTHPSKLICNFEGSNEEVLKDLFFVIGKDKPLIKVFSSE